MKASTKIKIEKKIAKLLGKNDYDVNFQDVRVLGGPDENVMIKADDVWFDTDNTGFVCVSY